MTSALRLQLSVAVCLALLAAFPATAIAAHCAPPGNAGVDQYLETVPGSSCSHPSSGGSGAGRHGALPASTRRQLARQGAAGEAVSRLVASSGAGATNGPFKKARGHLHTAARNRAHTDPPAHGAGQDPVSAAVHPVTAGSSSGGTGLLLPVLLGAALVVAVLVFVVRRRPRTAQTSGESEA